MLRRRKETPEFGLGECRFIETGRPEVLAHRCDLDGVTAFAVHNLGARRVRFDLPVDAPAHGCVHDVLARRREELQKDGHYRVDLEPYGYRWLRRDAGE